MGSTWGLLNKKPFKMPTFDNEHEEDIEPVQNEVAVENKPIESINDAIKNVIKKSMGADGLVKGLNQVGKALDKRSAYLCVLAEDCDDPKYKKLITSLAKQNKIPLITVEKRQDLGEWLGQCKYDKEGVARKTRGASSVAILNYGENSEALTYVEQYVKDHDL